MRTRPLVATVFAALFAAFLSACAAHAGVRLVAAPPPPPPAQVQPRPGYIYVSGHWVEKDAAWVWSEGYWVPARPGHVWIDGQWIDAGGYWRWRPGHWVAQVDGSIDTRPGL